MIASRWPALLLSALLGLAWLAPVQAVEVNGIDVPDTLGHDGTELALNGTGQRTRFRIKMYLGALWLPTTSQNAEAIIMADEPMVLKMYFQSDLLTGKRMEKALRKGFDTATNGNTVPIQDRVDTLSSLLRAQGLESGDTMTIAYTPGTGILLSKNDQELTTLQGLDFKQALLRIWLGDNPVQGKVKTGLLGG